jgi:hypothetical protein
MNKLKYIILIFTVFLVNEINANENFNFLKTNINTFHNLNIATLDFYKILEKNNSQNELNNATMKYVESLMENHNSLVLYSKSSIENIKYASSEYQKLILDLVKENYSFLNSISKTNLKKTELDKLRNEFKDKLGFVTTFFGNITMTACLTSTAEKKLQNNKQYSKLTLNERNELNSLIISKFGKSIKKGKKEKSKTKFEYSTRIIYEFLNLEWEFRTE